MNFYKKIVIIGLMAISLTPALGQVISGNVSLSVTSASSSVALPSSTTQYPAVVIAPAPGTTAEVFYAVGGSSVTATTTSPSLPLGGICFANIGAVNTYVAAITATGSATLRITQYTQCPQIYQARNGAGGTTYTAGSGITISGGVVSLGDANLTYSAGALATTSLVLGGLTLGTNNLVVGGTALFQNTAGGAIVRLYANSSSLLPALELQNNSGAAYLWLDAAGVFADRNATSAQAFRVGYSFTNATNYSYAQISAGQLTANELDIGSWHVGTPGGGGSLTSMKIFIDGTSKADYGVTNAGAWSFVGGVTASGVTSCVIKAIVGGIVTSATCT